MSVTRRATRNRVDPMPVRANHFFEKLESGVKRFGRGCVGVSYIALGAAIAGGTAYANSFPLSQLRDHELVAFGAGTVAVSILTLLYGFKIARRPHRPAAEKVVAIGAPSVMVAGTSWAFVNDLIASGFPVELLAADGVGVLVALGVKAWGARRLFEAWAGSRKPVEDFQHGSARFATRKTAAAHGINKNHGGDGNAVYIGHLVDEGVAHHPIYYSGDKHLLTVGPTGSRKTIGQVLCNLARFKQSVLVFDIKGTSARCTRELRSQFSNTVVFNPFCDDPLLKGLPDYGFNPLLGVGMSVNDPLFVDNTGALAAILVPVPKDDNPHWALGGRDLWHALLMYVIAKHGNKAHLGMARKLITEPPIIVQKPDGTIQYGGLAKTLIDMGEPGFAPPLVQEAMVNKVGRFLSARDEIGAIISAAISATGWIESPPVKKSLQGPAFDFDSMKRGNRPTTLYVCFPPGQLETHAPYLQLVLCSALRQMLTPRGNYRVLFMLDEFPVIGSIPQVPQAISIGRDYGLTLWGICQTFVQLQDLFGANWETVLSGCGAVTAFAPGELTTAEYVSRRCGNTTIRVAADHGKPRKAPRPRLALPGDSEGFHLVSEPLMRVEDCFGIEDGRALAWVRPNPETCVVEVPVVWNSPWAAGVRPNPFA